MSTTFPEFVKTLPEWHPVKTYCKENEALRQLLLELSTAVEVNDTQLFFSLFNQISEVDIHYTRKENQLFPYLEKYGWNGPSQGMWSFHDANRDILRGMRKKIEDKNLEGAMNDVPMLIGELQRMMLVEEMRLLPYAMELLNADDWKKMSEGEEEIGWCFNVRPALLESAPNEVKAAAESIQKNAKGLGGIPMEEGFMTVEQINLMLKFLPVDLTYVDENDRVLFYNRGEERVFPRSAAVIGREVRFCHPPKSVDTVLKILDEFRKGTKDDAEFWIDYRGKKVHIRYFAIRDAARNYKGVIEVSQDITAIQKLEGEQRLLSWK